MSDLGRVWRNAHAVADAAHGTRTLSAKMMRVSPNPGNYPLVAVACKRARVHRLVAGAFLGAAPGPVGRGAGGWQVNHKNGDRQDNRAENLEWVTREGNTRHAVDAGLMAAGERRPQSRLTDDDVRAIRARARAGEPHPSIARDYPVSRQTVQRAASGTGWRHVS